MLASLLLPALLAAPDAVAAGLADCPRHFDTAELLDAATSAEAAFQKVDAAGFAAGRSEMEARLACVGEIVSPSAIARVHRVETIASFLAKDAARVPQALAGTFAAEPGHQIPSSLLPDGHPIRAQVSVAMMALRDDVGAPLPALGSGWFEADGTSVKNAPAQRAAVIQQIDGQGQVLATHYRWPDETGFDWVVPGAGTAGTTEGRGSSSALSATTPGSATRSSTPSPWGRRAPLLALSAGSLVASGVLYALAAEGKAEFEASPQLGDDATDAERSAYRSELEGMQSETNGLSLGCYAALTVGLGLGAVVVVTW
jgi:hypothetical protein